MRRLVNNWQTWTYRVGDRCLTVGRRMDVDQLVGSAEIVEGRPRAVIRPFTCGYSAHTFPPPVLRLRMGTLWSWPDVRVGETDRSTAERRGSRGRIRRDRLVCAFLGLIIGNAKGKPGLGFILGLLLGVFGVLIIAGNEPYAGGAGRARALVAAAAQQLAAGGANGPGPVSLVRGADPARREGLPILRSRL